MKYRQAKKRMTQKMTELWKAVRVFRDSGITLRDDPHLYELVSRSMKACRAYRHYQRPWYHR